MILQEICLLEENRSLIEGNSINIINNILVSIPSSSIGGSKNCFIFPLLPLINIWIKQIFKISPHLTSLPKSMNQTNNYFLFNGSAQQLTSLPKNRARWNFRVCLVLWKENGRKKIAKINGWIWTKEQT
jgi:hypothetical protein